MISAKADDQGMIVDSIKVIMLNFTKQLPVMPLRLRNPVWACKPKQGFILFGIYNCKLLWARYRIGDPSQIVARFNGLATECVFKGICPVCGDIMYATGQSRRVGS